MRRKDDEEESDELLENESQNKEEVTEDLEIAQSSMTKDAKVDEESGSLADEKATSKLNLRVLEPKKDSPQKEGNWKKLETEEIAISEEKIEKSLVVVQRKSSKPIAANIETDAEDLVANQMIQVL